MRRGPVPAEGGFRQRSVTGNPFVLLAQYSPRQLTDQEGSEEPQAKTFLRLPVPSNPSALAGLECNS